MNVKDKVKIAKGKKFPIGVVGVVFWVAPTPDGYGTTKVGMLTEAGDKIFINEANLEVIVAAAVDPFANYPSMHNGRQVMAFGGAVQQDGGLLVFRCGKCKDEIVKVKSKKTGNSYWVNCFNKKSGGMFYVKNQLHTADYCAERVKEIQENADHWTAYEEKQRVDKIRYAIMDSMTTDEVDRYCDLRKQSADEALVFMNSVAIKNNLQQSESIHSNAFAGRQTNVE